MASIFENVLSTFFIKKKKRVLQQPQPHKTSNNYYNEHT